MSRQFPTRVPAAPRQSTISRDFEIEIITPLFGGGVAARVSDPVTLVRGTSIRGHLRFWWRATRGRAFSDSRQLHAREAEIWGSTSGASKVRIEVEMLNSGQPVGQNSDAYPKYVLFPFSNEETANARTGVSFKLAMSFPDELEDEVKPAVWAWTNFGGLGSRTRRGCGALYCRETAAASRSNLVNWWRSFRNLCTRRAADSDSGWPQIGLRFYVSPSVSNPVTAWNQIISKMSDFRQRVGFARDPATERSRWPEADSLRAKTGSGVSAHMRSITLPSPVKPGFPRAMLGLPIVFRFKDGFDEDPNGGTLKPISADRMGSPIILRPMKTNDGSSFGIALPLITQFPEGLRYTFKNTRQKDLLLAPSTYQGKQLANYPDAPLHGHSPSGSAYEGFIDFLKNEGLEAVQ